MTHETEPAMPYLSFYGSPICMHCGRGFERGERTDLLCGGRRTLPMISIDGESSFQETEHSMLTFDLVHRECSVA